MEHGPTDTSIGSETPEPQVPAHQTPPGALPALGERKPFSLWQLGGAVRAAAATFGEVVVAKALVSRHPAVAGHLDGDGNGDAPTIGRIQTGAQRVRVDGEAGEGSGSGVEGSLVEGEGLQPRVGTWGDEMEERAMEAARAIQERKRAKDELVELGKEHEFLQAETERLRLQFVKMIKQAQREAGDWRDPLWLNANGVLQQFDSTRAEEERVGAKLKRARKYLDRAEKEAEKRIGELGRVMGGALDSVDGVGGPEVEVQEEDVKVGTKSEEVVREFARD
ncbi:hypothetical protein DFP73DRAFT_635926 [Morchella snyderi]|nr:hypothetical protein DFP73DRAFT_635926 [Morchella snyderi]